RAVSRAPPEPSPGGPAADRWCRAGTRDRAPTANCSAREARNTKPSTAAARTACAGSYARAASRSRRWWRSTGNRRSLRPGCSFFDPECIRKNFQFQVGCRHDLSHDHRRLRGVERLELANHLVDTRAADMIAEAPVLFLDDETGHDEIAQRFHDHHPAAAELLDELLGKPRPVAAAPKRQQQLQSPDGFEEPGGKAQDIVFGGHNEKSKSRITGSIQMALPSTRALFSHNRATLRAERRCRTGRIAATDWGVGGRLRTERRAQICFEALARDGLLQNRNMSEFRIDALATVAGDEGERDTPPHELCLFGINALATEIEIEDGAVEFAACGGQRLGDAAAGADHEQAMVGQDFAHHHTDDRVILDDEHALHGVGRQLHQVLVTVERGLLRRAAFALDRYLHGAMQPARPPVPDDVAADLMLDAGVENLGAEALCRRGLHRRPSGLSPGQRENIAVGPPADGQSALRRRQGAVFR